jgi:hypothetical protein
MKSHSRDLIQILNTLPSVATGVEVGVWEGLNSVCLLEAFPRLKLLMVDAYRVYGDSKIGGCQERLNKALIQASELTSFAADRRVLMVGDSVECANWIEDGSLDFAFIDGCHQYEFVKRDLEAYWDKVQEGGVVAGHDYNGMGDRRGWFGVKRAVDEFAKMKGFNVESGGRLIWWTRKT